MRFSLCGLVSCLLLQLAVATNERAHGFFSQTTGLLREDFSRNSFTAPSLLACTAQGCENLNRCVASFNKKTGACRTAILSAVPLSWTKEHLFSSSSNEDWVSFAPSESLPAQPLPSGLWAMDESLRGRNLGSKGAHFDSSDEGLTWTSPGPLGTSSSLKYARLDGSQKAKIVNQHNGSYFIDFTRPFSVGFWAKTDNPGATFPVLDGWSTSRNTFAFYIWFFRSKNSDQITVYSKYGVKSFKNGANKQFWRHIAVTYRGGNNYSFFLNGTFWPISEKYINNRTNFADFVNIGHRGASVFKGALACIAYSESPLELDQVRTLMHSCP